MLWYVNVNQMVAYIRKYGELRNQTSLWWLSRHKRLMRWPTDVLRRYIWWTNLAARRWMRWRRSDVIILQEFHESAALSYCRRTRVCINSILENVSFVKMEDVILHGSPLTSKAIRPQLQHKLSIFKAMTEKLSLLDRHPAFFLLKTAFKIK